MTGSVFHPQYLTRQKPVANDELRSSKGLSQKRASIIQLTLAALKGE
jgi:hypothetical protein